MRCYNKGWMSESERHSLAARGIKTGSLRFIEPPKFTQPANVLPVQVSIIVPSTIGDKDISPKQFAARVKSEREFMSQLFGGDTSHSEVGGYWNGHKLINEKSMMVEVSTTIEKYNKLKDVLGKHVSERQKDWGQESMLMKVEGESFITPKQNQIDSERGASKILVTAKGRKRT
jgi:hypothetical protein